MRSALAALQGKGETTAVRVSSPEQPLWHQNSLGPVRGDSTATRNDLRHQFHVSRGGWILLTHIPLPSTPDTPAVVPRSEVFAVHVHRALSPASSRDSCSVIAGCRTHFQGMRKSHTTVLKSFDFSGDLKAGLKYIRLEEIDLNKI